MTIDPTDNYAIAYSDILRAIRSADSSQVDSTQIRRILDGERGRWMMVSLDRLRKFGYHVDTF